MSVKPERQAFNAHEWKMIAAHRTPAQAQRFLSALGYNREREGPTLRSFRAALRRGSLP